VAVTTEVVLVMLPALANPVLQGHCNCHREVQIHLLLRIVAKAPRSCSSSKSINRILSHLPMLALVLLVLLLPSLLLVRSVTAGWLEPQRLAPNLPLAHQ
jgi:hypothetical protein